MCDLPPHCRHRHKLPLLHESVPLEHVVRLAVQGLRAGAGAGRVSVRFEPRST